MNEAPGNFQMRKAGLLMLITFMMSQAAPAKTVTLLSPTGPYAVGRSIFRWTDPSRAEVLSSKPNDKREVIVWLWYPAVPQARAKTAPYVDRLDSLARALPRAEVALARSVETHAVVDAAPLPAPAQFPVILFSPGAGTIPALYTSFCEDLASHGYIVAALDHPYDDEAVLVSDGRVVKQAKQPSGGEELLRFERERVSVRVQDIRFVLEQLAQMQSGRINSLLRGRLNLARTGVFGHSVGGMTAAESCMRDSRVLACANLDGVISAMPAYPDEAGRGPAQPFLFIEKPLPAMRGEKPEDAQRRLTFLREKGNALLASVRSGRSYRVTITGATHASFSDEEILSDVKAERQRELLDFVRAYLRAFFDQSLRDQQPPLLNTPPSDDAIRVAVFMPK